MITFCIWLSCSCVSSLLEQFLCLCLSYLDNGAGRWFCRMPSIWGGLVFSQDLVEIMQLGRNNIEVMSCP